MHSRTKLKNIYTDTTIFSTQGNKITMSGIQSKITRHAKKRENMTFNQKINQSTKTNSDLGFQMETWTYATE